MTQEVKDFEVSEVSQNEVEDNELQELEAYENYDSNVPAERYGDETTITLTPKQAISGIVIGSAVIGGVAWAGKKLFDAITKPKDDAHAKKPAKGLSLGGFSVEVNWPIKFHRNKAQAQAPAVQEAPAPSEAKPETEVVDAEIVK